MTWAGYRNQIQRWRMIGLAMSGPKGIILDFLFNDEFLTDEAAPLTSPRTAEPGPGTGVVVDTGNNVTIAGSKFVVGGVAGNGDPGYSNDVIVTRAQGIALYGVHNTGGKLRVGFDGSKSSSLIDELAFAWNSSIELRIFDDSNETSTIEILTADTDYKTAVILRSAGAFFAIKGGTEFSDWTLVWIAIANTTASLFGQFSRLTAGASVHDNMRVSQLSGPWLTDSGIALLYDNFTRADGVLGTAEKGGAWVFDSGIWTIASNKAVGAPVAGATLWDADAAVFVAGTYAWVAQGANTIANVANTLQITFVDNANGAKEFLSNAADLSANLTVGTWYELSLDWKINASSAKFRITTASATFISNLLSNTLFDTKAFQFLGDHATANFLDSPNMGGTEVVTIDNLSLKPLTASELFSSLESSENEVLVDVDVTLRTDHPNMTAAGLITHLDDATTPANYLVAYHNGTKAQLYKVVGGTYTSLISASKTYSAGARLSIVAYRDGADLKVSLYYNNSLAGVQQTISDAGIVDNTIHGLFSTFQNNTLDNFRVWPRNITGEAKDYLDALEAG